MTVEARCPNDGMIEAIRYDSARGSVNSYVVAVQWHPEFHDRAALKHFIPAEQPGWQPPAGLPDVPALLDDDPILSDFLAAARSTAAA
jgi:putative glutamine amidotransferase